MTTAAEQSSIRRVVAVNCILGLVASLIVVALSLTVWAPITGSQDLTAPQWVAIFIALTTLGQVVFVRVRHGATYEELTFYEVVLAAALLLLAPSAVLIALLTGMFLGELLLHRPAIKIAFNLGNYALATSAMIVTYHALDTLWHPAGTYDPLSLHSMFSLLVASGVFTAVNLSGLAQLFHTTSGATRREVFAEEWRLSAFMAIGSSGIGAVAVALGTTEGTRALLPFAFMPVVALWYAYGASAQHAEARERNRWLVTLGSALAQHGQGTSTLEDSTEAIRQIVSAPEKSVLRPVTGGDEHDGRTERILASMWIDPGPRVLDPGELPPGWRTGVVTRLDLGTAQPGALLLGSTEVHRRSRLAGQTTGWALDEADAPVLGALVAAVGSAMRAGAAFDALTEETAKLTAVVDNTSDGIAMVDDSGRVRLWSQTMARMTGVEASELHGDVTGAPEIVRTLVAASLEADATPGAAPVHVHLVRDDGEELDVSLATVRVREASTSSSADSSGWVSILTVHDETRERRVERLKTDFVATISHELRTPITPIKGYAHLLATRGDRMNAEKRTQALQVISDRADHLSRLVDDLLLASHVSDTARLAIEMNDEDLGTVVRQAVAGFPSMAKRIDVSLPDVPIMVQCDRIRAVQCLANLIGNAEKYAPADTRVEVRVDSSGLQARVHVRDHGTGIPDSEREKVFERFYRREDPFTMRTGGAGLGLHIARELAVAMGGGLTVTTPAEGTGAEFVLHLPTTAAPRIASATSGEARTRRPNMEAPASDTASPDDTLTRALAEGGTMDQDDRAVM